MRTPVSIGLLGWLLAVGALCVFSMAGEAEAKGPSWIISGGELGDYAMKFHPDAPDEGEIAVLPGERVAAPDNPGPGYEIYSDTHLFSPEFHLVTVYFPDVDLLFGHPGHGGSDAWMHPAEATRGLLERAIEKALSEMDRGELEQGLVAANLRGHNLHQATYAFSPYGGTVRDWPRFELTGDSGDAELALQHLAATIELDMTSQATDKPLYHFTVSGQGSGGYYSPPSAGVSGRWFTGSWNLNEPNTYYETTPGFDAYIAAAIERARAEQQPEERDASKAVTVVPCPAAAECWTGRELSEATGRPAWAWKQRGLAAVLGVLGVSGFFLAMRPALAHRD